MHKIKIRGVIKNGNNIFLSKVTKGGFYCLPGGTYEGGETFKECLEREFIEELNIKPDIGECILIREFKSASGDLYLDLWFKINNVQDFDTINNNHASHSFEISEEKFYTPEEISLLDVRPENLIGILKNDINIMFI